MRTHHILFALAGLALLAGGAYLMLSVGEEPGDAKPKTVAADKDKDQKSSSVVRRRPTVPGEIVLPNEGEMPEGMPNNGRTFIRRSTSPDLLPDGSKRPEPFQARSKPAKNEALFVGVHSEEMMYKVDNVNTAYLKGRYEEVLAEAPALIEAIPENQQLKRLLIRSACLARRTDIAKAYLPTVSESDQAYMKTHCLTYGSPLE